MLKRRSDVEERTATTSESEMLIDEATLNSKKMRLEAIASDVPSSRVLHVGKLPTDVTENEVATLAIPFGQISNMVLTKKTGQALVEMALLEAAVEMVQYYNTMYRPSIRNHGPLMIQYSKYPALTTPGASQNVSEAITAANKKVEEKQRDGERRILRVQVEKAIPPVQLGYMPFYQAFSRFGSVLKVVVFKANSYPQALIELGTPISAHVAKLQMNSVPLFPEAIGGSSTSYILRTDFSRQQALEIHREDENCRDFSLYPLSSERPGGIITIPPRPQSSGDVSHHSMAMSDQVGIASSTAFDTMAGRVLKPLLRAICGPDGINTQEIHSHLMSLQRLAVSANELGLLDSDDTITNATLLQIPSLMATLPVSVAMNSGASPVVIASNLETQHVTPDTLFILFGVYGDVQRVKILFSKKDTALIQLSDGFQAETAIKYLNGIPLYGKLLRCSFSKHSQITAAPNNVAAAAGNVDSESASTKDYVNHRLHRFKRANSRNHQNIYPPSTVLHVSNLPEGTSSDLLLLTFQEAAGITPVQCQMMPSEKRMALVQFEDIGKAVMALIAMHDYPLAEKTRIRVTFSKSAIRP